MARGNNYSCYAVREGRRPGLYHTWADCEKQVKCYSGARFKGFVLEPDAVKWLAVAGIDVNKLEPESSASPTPPPATFDPPVQHGSSSYASHASGPFYAVAKGRKPGIYKDWDDCRDQVDGFSCARYKKFTTLAGAQEFCAVYGGGGHFSLFTSAGFQPDQKASFSDEWARLSQSQGWARGTWQYQKQRAAALRNEIQTHFFATQSTQLPPVKAEDGAGASGIKKEEHEDAGLEAVSEFNQQRHEAAIELLGFQSMCRAVGKIPGETKAQCEMILKSTLINIVDLLDARRLGRDTTRLPWTNFNAFKAYTLDPQQDKTIPVKSAKADPILRCFLQNFSAPRGGRASYPYAAPLISSVPAPVAPPQQQSPAQYHNHFPNHDSRWRTPTSAERQDGWVLIAKRAMSEEEDDFEDQGHQQKKVKVEEVIEAQAIRTEEAIEAQAIRTEEAIEPQVTKAEEVTQANDVTDADLTQVEVKPKKRGRPAKKVKAEEAIEAENKPRKRGRPAKKAKVEEVIEAQVIKAEEAIEPQVINTEVVPQANNVTHADVTQVEDVIVVKEVHVKLERDIEAKNLRRREMKKIQQRWTPSNSIMRSWISSSV